MPHVQNDKDHGRRPVTLQAKESKEEGEAEGSEEEGGRAETKAER